MPGKRRLGMMFPLEVFGPLVQSAPDPGHHLNKHFLVYDESSWECLNFCHFASRWHLNPHFQPLAFPVLTQIRTYSCTSVLLWTLLDLLLLGDDYFYGHYSQSLSLLNCLHMRIPLVSFILSAFLVRPNKIITCSRMPIPKTS